MFSLSLTFVKTSVFLAMSQTTHENSSHVTIHATLHSNARHSLNSTRTIMRTAIALVLFGCLTVVTGHGDDHGSVGHNPTLEELLKDSLGLTTSASDVPFTTYPTIASIETAIDQARDTRDNIDGATEETILDNKRLNTKRNRKPGKWGDCAMTVVSDGECGQTCKTEDDCPGSQTCCSRGCGRQCEDPTTLCFKCDDCTADEFGNYINMTRTDNPESVVECSRAEVCKTVTVSVARENVPRKTIISTMCTPNCKSFQQLSSTMNMTQDCCQSIDDLGTRCDLEVQQSERDSARGNLAAIGIFLIILN